MSPLSDYFGGHGEDVMKAMKKKYGRRAKEVFYATANKSGKKRKKVKDYLE